MIPANFADLFRGPPGYRAKTGWGPLTGAIAAVAIFLIAAFVSGVVVGGIADVFGHRPEAVSAVGSQWGQAVLLLQQIGIVALVLVAGHMLGSQPMPALSLYRPPKGSLLPAFLLVVALSLTYTALIWPFASDKIIADLQPFISALKGDHWLLLAIAVAIGAPLSEEFLFRGFLFPVLANSRIGLIGATLISNAAWTALHTSYSVFGLIDIFLIGLVLTWLLWRTGSLWVPIICHGLYNSLVFAGLFGYVVFQ